MITAKEAAELLNTEVNEAATKELAKIEEAVVRAIKHGSNSVRIDYNISDVAKKKLEALGYKVKNNSGGDWRDAWSNCDISW